MLSWFRIMMFSGFRSRCTIPLRCASASPAAVSRQMRSARSIDSEPRAFKSHEPWETIPKGEGARYIYVARDPLDAFVSFHRFLPAYCGVDPAAISAQEFADAVVAGVARAARVPPGAAARAGGAKFGRGLAARAGQRT